MSTWRNTSANTSIPTQKEDWMDKLRTFIVLVLIFESFNWFAVNAEAHWSHSASTMADWKNIIYNDFCHGIHSGNNWGLALALLPLTKKLPAHLKIPRLWNQRAHSGPKPNFHASPGRKVNKNVNVQRGSTDKALSTAQRQNMMLFPTHLM